MSVFRFFFHIGVEYLFTLWACFMLYREYNTVALMRLQYLASQRRRPEQFTVSENFKYLTLMSVFLIHLEFCFLQVVVRNVPDMPGHSVPDTVDQFFRTNHPEHYLCHQVIMFCPYKLLIFVIISSIEGSDLLVSGSL